MDVTRTSKHEQGKRTEARMQRCKRGEKKVKMEEEK